MCSEDVRSQGLANSPNHVCYLSMFEWCDRVIDRKVINLMGVEYASMGMKVRIAVILIPKW